MDGWMDGWRDGWIDGWMDGWMEGWAKRKEHPLNERVMRMGSREVNYTGATGEINYATHNYNYFKCDS